MFISTTFSYCEEEIIFEKYYNFFYKKGRYRDIQIYHSCMFSFTQIDHVRLLLNVLSFLLSLLLFLLLQTQERSAPCPDNA